MTILRTNSLDLGFVDLVRKLDQYLAIVDGNEHDFYAQYNTIDTLNHVIVFYHDEAPVACGAIKEIAPNVWEIKRMYVDMAFRNMGIASKVIFELENWAKELNAKKIVLETGKRMQDAINLYNKNNYKTISNYGQYIGIENSVCFEKLF